jgi:hypothetical protein
MKIQQIYLVFIMRRLESSWMRQILQSYSECTPIQHYCIEADAVKSIYISLILTSEDEENIHIHC